MKKKLLELFRNLDPKFQEGGEFYPLHSLYDAVKTFLFVPAHPTPGRLGVHVRDKMDLKRLMVTVVVALIPATLFGIWNIGHQHYLVTGEAASCLDKFLYGLGKFLPIYIVTMAVGGTIEGIFAQVRKHQINEGFLVTGLLIPLVMPPDIPLWMVAVATAFAVIIGKEVLGGTGMNIFNPALLARAFVFFSYPAHISGDKVWIAGLPDGVSAATPLGQAAIHEPIGYSLWDMIWGTIPGSIGETSFIMIALGAAILILTRVASWEVIFSVFAGATVMGLLFNAFPANPYMEIPFYYHYFMGGLAFGAVFMATDPVTSARTRTGKFIYGFLIGVVALLVRVVNPAYPEGVMLAILLMNAAAPLIDYIVIERNIKKRLRRVSR